MPISRNAPDTTLFENLFRVWEQRKFDLVFYFEEIFDRALASLKAKVETGEIRITLNNKPKYKAMFIPVGFRIENVALMAGLFQPLHVTLAFSESTRSFHRRHIEILENKLHKYFSSMTIYKSPTLSKDDQPQMEQRVIKWTEELKKSDDYSEAEIAIDLTGGTKPMSVGAQNAAKSLGIPAFYLGVDFDGDTQMPIPGTEYLVQMLSRPSQTDKNLVFVIMPFRSEFDTVYDHIKEGVESSGSTCLRVDEDIFQGGIMDRIRENITRAGTIIADLSEENTNVYYELGLAHAQRKNVIMLTQSMDTIPSNLKPLRMVVYDGNSPDELRDKLQKELSALQIT